MPKRIGICINFGGCEKAKAREKQEADVTNFVCECCGKPLREVKERTDDGNKMKLIIGIVAVIVVLGGIGAYFAFTDTDSNSKKSAEEKAEQIVVTDSVISPVVDEVPIKEDNNSLETLDVEPEKVITEQKAKPEIPVVDGKYQLSYGYYTGDIKDGYPHGQGRLTYTVERQINKYDMKKRTAKVGQYVIGEFQRGFFIQGRLYAADGELLESIMIGTAPGDTYEKL